MRTIHKYVLEVTDEQTIKLPVGSETLCVQTQNEIPCLWTMVDVDTEYADEKTIHISTYGTGHPMPPVPGRYIGTYQLNDGALVFHVFERRSI